MKSVVYLCSIALAVVLLAVSCSGYGGMGEASLDESAYSKSAEPMPAASAEEFEQGGIRMEIADEVSPDSSFDSESDNGGTADGDQGQQRKRVYNGSAGLIVEDADESRRELEELAREYGGYVESSYTEYVVLRVPAESFDEIFSKVLGMGTVEYNRVETWDVTEAYADITRRLSTSEETRRRLYILLEESTDPAERAKILKEIGRLTEEIEALKQQLAVMDARVSFSRITVQLTPRIQGDAQRQDIPFPWISSLNPLSPAGEALKARFDVNLGPEFAVFDKENVFMAENSDGVQVLASSVDNSPRGDAGFWRKAIIHHLEPYYAETSEQNVSIGGEDVLGVEFVSKDREPFKYFVGIVADGRRLHIFEIFSPDGNHDFSRLYDAFAEGELK